MAEFCLECWNKMNHTRLEEEDVILSAHLDLCEGCAEMKRVVENDGRRKKNCVRIRGGKAAAGGTLTPAP